MIICIFGLPGAGKTTLLTVFSIKALKDRPLSVGHFSFKVPIGDNRHYKRVFSNVPLDGCYKLDFDYLGKYEFDDSLILIDEAGTLCDSRNWKNFDEQLRDFLALHRHYCCDIIIFSQSLDIDKKIRDRTALVLYIKKFGSFTRIQTINKDWKIREMKELYEPAPPLACSYIYRPFYYSAFDSYEAPPLPHNPLPLWSEITEVHKYVPYWQQLVRKAQNAWRLCRGVVLRRAATIFRRKKQDDSTGDRKAESMACEHVDQDRERLNGSPE